MEPGERLSKQVTKRTMDFLQPNRSWDFEVQEIIVQRIWDHLVRNVTVPGIYDNLR